MNAGLSGWILCSHWVETAGGHLGHVVPVSNSPFLGKILTSRNLLQSETSQLHPTL